MLLIGAATIFFVWKTSPQSPVLGVQKPEETVLPEVAQEYTVKFGDTTYQVNLAVVDTHNLLLIPNFTEKKIAKNIYEENKCKLLANGGFYSEDNKPIGLFISNRERLSDFAQNSLFNGFLTINDFETPRITSQLPEDQLIIGLQAGPMLQENDSEHTLKLARDKAARRMVAAVTGENKLIFMAIYRSEAVFSGPFLKDLPGIISQLEKEADIEIADAINLDGGAASAFIFGQTNLSEASPVGSFFCAKQ